MIEKIFILLIAFQFKHLIADYYLQFPYMYENKGKAVGWAKPLFDHAATHSFLTMAIVATVTLDPLVSVLAMLFDFTTHFAIDRWKATRGHHPGESKFWTDLGIDQMLHHIVGIIIIGGIYYGTVY